MAIPAYMWIKDDQGSEIEGSVSIAIMSCVYPPMVIPVP